MFEAEARFCPQDGTPLPAVDPEHSDPLLGVLIDGRYEVQAVLGRGAAGVVFSVRHAVLQRQFAVKVLHAELVADRGLAARFQRQARAAAKVRHPSVCEIADFGELTDGRPYLVLELLGGTSLSRWLAERGPMSLQPALTIVEAVAGALGAAHAAGVVHRDLKPANIIIDDGERPESVKVLGLGLAEVVEGARLPLSGSSFGTVAYMSPEQACGDEVDHRTDLYSLGVVFFELLTGKAPFQAETHAEWSRQLRFVEPRRPSELVPRQNELELGGAAIPPALDAIVMRCLNKAPGGRYPNADVLLSDLRALRGDATPRPPSAGPPKLPVDLHTLAADPLIPADWERSGSPWPRRVAWLSLAVVVVVVSGGVVLQRASGTRAGSKVVPGAEHLAPVPHSALRATEAREPRSPSVVPVEPDSGPVSQPRVADESEAPRRTQPVPFEERATSPERPAAAPRRAPAAARLAPKRKPLPVVGPDIIDPWAD
jgi:serine/threonine protein kinase